MKNPDPSAPLPPRSTLKSLRVQWSLMNAYERFEQIIVLALGRDDLVRHRHCFDPAL